MSDSIIVTTVIMGIIICFCSILLASELNDISKQLKKLNKTRKDNQEMKIAIIEYGREPKQFECESFEFRSNKVSNWIKIKKSDGAQEMMRNVCVIKTLEDKTELSQ